MGADWYEADKSVLGPMVKEATDRYAAEAGQAPRRQRRCNS